MRRAIRLVLLGALGLAASSRVEAAEQAPPAASDADTPPPRVELTLVGEAPGGSALLERATSWFRDPRVTTESTRASAVDADAVFAPGGVAGVRIWIWLRTPSAARVFVAAHEPATGAARYWVSDVPLRSGLDELGSEELAQLVHLSALAVWAGNLESRRSEVEASLAPSPPTSKPAPPPRDRSAAADAGKPTRAFTLGAQYSLRFAGDEGVPQVVAAVLGVAWRAPRRESALRAHVGALIPRHVTSSDLQLSLAGAGALLEAVGAWQQTSSLWLTAAAGPGLDVVHFSAVSTEMVQAEPAATDVRPFAQAGLGVRADLGAVSFNATALVLVQWLRVHYDVMRDGKQEEVLAPWLVQPGAALGATW